VDTRIGREALISDSKKLAQQKMSQRTRKSLKTSEYGLPNQEKYPVNDRKHAILAKGYAKKELNLGNLSQGQYKQIVAKANKKLGSNS